MNLFEGRDIRVVARLFDEDKKNLVITFTGRAASPPVEKGFGEAYLIKRGVSAIHFISNDNHWWQTPEPAEAIAELHRRGLIGPDRRITLYGSSMGGYAALILSGLIKPKRIVLFSPQFSIDPKRVPFEKRWRAYAAKLNFAYDDMAAGIDHESEIKAVYDPFFKPDRQHIELIEKIRPVDHVHVRFAGHNTARALEELGIITRVIDALLFKEDGERELVGLYRQMRHASTLYWYGLSQVLSEHGHRAASMFAAAVAVKILLHSGRMKDRVLRLDILQWAISAACRSDKLLLAKLWLAELEKVETSTSRTAYSRALVAQVEKNWPEANRQATIAAGRRRSDAPPAALKLEALARTSGPASAMAYLEELPPVLRRSPPVLLAHAHLLADAKDWAAALEILQQYIRHERLDPAARALSARCLVELGRPDAALKQLSPVLHYHIASDRLFEEIAKLVENERGARHAGKLTARHKRYSRRFSTVLSALDSTDWNDRNELAKKLSNLFRTKALPLKELSEIAAL